MAINKELINKINYVECLKYKLFETINNIGADTEKKRLYAKLIVHLDGALYEVFEKERIIHNISRLEEIDIHLEIIEKGYNISFADILSDDEFKKWKSILKR